MLLRRVGYCVQLGQETGSGETFMFHLTRFLREMQEHPLK